MSVHINSESKLLSLISRTKLCFIIIIYVIVSSYMSDYRIYLNFLIIFCLNPHACAQIFKIIDKFEKLLNFKIKF